jgi:hypothetical protein
MASEREACTKDSMKPFHAQVADTLADYNSEVDSIRAKSVASVKVGKRSFTLLFILKFGQDRLGTRKLKKGNRFLADIDGLGA